jgi:hypothetical protein
MKLLTIITACLAAAAPASAAAALNITDLVDFAQSIGQIQSQLLLIKRFATTLPFFCPRNASEHFFTIQTAFPSANVSAVENTVGNFSSLSWANITDTPANGSALNPLPFGDMRMEEFMGNNITNLELFNVNLENMGIFAQAFTQTFGNQTAGVINGTSYDKIVSALIGLNNTVSGLNNTVSMGTHVIWATVGCTNDSSEASDVFGGMANSALQSLDSRF